MVGIHNYYLDFLKSFKKFISDSYPDINHYQFNYSSSTYLNYQLYKEHVKEFPICHINLNNIQVQDIESIKRLTQQNDSHSFHLCNNDTKRESVYLDFKFVTLQMQVRINLGASIDIFNYLDIGQSQFPLNFMFYDYKYNSFINLTDVAKDWEIDDETEGVYYRSVHGVSEKYALYVTEPIIKINSLTSSKQLELKSQDSNFIEFDIEVQLKVPRKISKNSIESNILKGIEILINTNSYSESMPIMIDMNNNVYSDLQNKAQKVFIIPRDKLDIETYQVRLPLEYLVNIEGRKLAIYLIDDSCKSNPNIIFIELDTYESLVTNEKIQITDSEVIITINKTTLDTDLLNNFTIGELSVLELITFK